MTKDIKQQVKEQYERYPYPVPDESLDEYIEKQFVQTACPSHYFHWYWPYKGKTENLDVLVAGCGCVQAAHLAVNSSKTRIHGIDISQASLKHTQMLLDKHNITNVKLHELRIENVAELGIEFDLIISTGVLHHLPDPEEGFKALQKVLKPDGSMYIMLYGAYGRSGVYPLQDMFNALGLNPETVTPQEIKKIKETIDKLPADHPFQLNRRYFELDLGFEGGIVDAFLHQQDRAYTIPDIYKLLDTCDLQMQKMVNRAHYAPGCSSLVNTPFFDAICALPDREQFTITEAYRGSIHTHFFIACRKDRPDETFKIDLDGDDWKQFIPIKNFSIDILDKDPDDENSVCQIKWATHRYDEIRFSATAVQWRVFEMINDKRTIEEIMTNADLEADQETLDSFAKVFFKAMYDFDYVWFRKKN